MNRRPTPSIIDDVLTTDTTRAATIRNDAIKVDGGTQMRAQLDAATVAEYADTMAASGWGAFPPIIAYYDGSDYWLADGFHRLAAWRSLADFSDALIPADVRSGTRRDAILHAAGANASHGLRRTNADKRRAVETLLRDEEWAKWSNGEIARRCAVSDVFVGKVRDDLSPNGLEIPPKRTVTRNGTTYTQNTANIGPVPQPIPTPTAKEYAAAVQASTAPAAPARPSVYSILHTPPVPGWDDDDEAEYQALLPTWQQPAGQFNAIIELDRITRRRVAERMSLERLDNLRHSLQERRRELWHEERRQERSASAISNQQSPISNPAPVADAELPAWAQEEPASISKPGQSVADYLAYRDGAWASGMAAMDIRQWRDWLDAQEPAPPANAYDALTLPDGRIPAARHLMALYGAVIDSEEQYGELTGRFSDTLTIKRELTHMITHLADLIAAIEHPEEVTPDA